MRDAPDLTFEQELWRAGLSRVAGMDEAGRGAMAGPVSVGETLSGKSNITAKRLEIYTGGSLVFKRNGGAESLLFKDETGYYHLLLQNGDIFVNTFTVTHDSMPYIYVACILKESAYGYYI